MPLIQSLDDVVKRLLQSTAILYKIIQYLINNLGKAVFFVRASDAQKTLRLLLIKKIQLRQCLRRLCNCAFSDRVVVMSNGLIEQSGTPFEIYNFPTTVFVASFVGTLNLIEVVVTDASQGEFTIDGQKVHAAKPLEFQNNDKIKIALRPKIISLRSGGPEYNQLSAVVDTVIFLSSLVRIQVKFGANHLVFDIFNNPNLVPPKLADNVTLFF